ncbi:hypothetical protein C8R43DRAFT_884471 [Mycena crocata]|nr:hypothetical protein C8R43DRAFT_884471 [Mycena crocata]
MSTSAEKTAEFAKLFDLFEMLATRRSRTTATTSILDDTRAIPVPAELEPVFRSLATVVPPRQSSSTSSRPRRNTVAALGRTTYPDSDGDSDSDIESDIESVVESVAKFPLGKAYAFRFKMMIHKLYQADEWAQKVRDVLKKSQTEYKPLAEVEVEHVDAPSDRVGDGRVHFKTEVAVGGKKNMPLAQGRQRSYSAAGLGKAAATSRVPGSVITQSPAHLEARAVKKRCIGRRKSVSGVPSPATAFGEGWIYDAAISAAEIRERVPIEFTGTFSTAPHPRPRYQSLQNGSRKMGGASRRIVSAIPTEAAPASVVESVVESVPRTSTKRRLTE